MSVTFKLYLIPSTGMAAGSCPYQTIYIALFLAGQGKSRVVYCFDEQTNTRDRKGRKNIVLSETGIGPARASLVMIKLSAQISRQGRLALTQVAQYANSLGGS